MARSARPWLGLLASVTVAPAISRACATSKAINGLRDGEALGHPPVTLGTDQAARRCYLPGINFNGAQHVDADNFDQCGSSRWCCCRSSQKHPRSLGIHARQLGRVGPLKLRSRAHSRVSKEKSRQRGRRASRGTGRRRRRGRARCETIPAERQGHFVEIPVPPKRDLLSEPGLKVGLDGRS